jgi:ferrous iron transport protein A
MLNLTEVNLGETVSVNSVIENALKSQLMELGIVHGQEITVLFKAPFGDPIAIDMNGYVLSLRKSEAALIEISRISN